MTVGQLILYPFSLLYGGIMAVRNRLYDAQQFRSEQFSLPVISIGNLTVGGTGKTPHVEYILRLLRGKKLATLSRGYQRQTKGYILADATANAATLGDEPYQYFQDFPEVTVAVSENRAVGIQQLLKDQPDLDAIILDDAYQHRGVTPSLNILLTDYRRLFYQDLVLPAGRLREFPGGAARADVVIVTKCDPTLDAARKESICTAVNRAANRQIPVYFTRYDYGAPVNLSQPQEPAPRILLVTAIANPAPLVQYLQQAGYQILEHFRFPDHHRYTNLDLQKIYLAWQRYTGTGKVVVFTTRKDATKLTDAAFGPFFAQMPFFYIPIKVTFVENQANFDRLIINHLATRSKPEFN